MAFATAKNYFRPFAQFYEILEFDYLMLLITAIYNL